MNLRSHGAIPPPHWSVLACALLVLMAAYSVHLGEDLRFPDEADYIDYARHLLGGRGYSLDGVSPDAYRPPGYGILLAVPIALHDSVHLIRLAQIALLLSALALLARFVDTSGRAVGVVSPAGGRVALRWLLLAACCYPVLLYTAGTVFPQTVLMVLLAAIVRLACTSSEPAPGRLAGAGLLAGLAIEVSPTVLSVLPLLVVAAVAGGNGRARRLLLVLLCVSVVPGTWLARNLVVLDEPILFSRNLAENIDNAVLSVDPLDSGESRPPDGVVGYALERLHQLVSEPGAYLERVGEFFAFRNTLHVASEASPLRDAVMFVTYYTLLALVLLRLVFAWSGRASRGEDDWSVPRPLSRAEVAVIACYVLTALFHAMVFARIRYRLPFDLLLLVPAVNAAAILMAGRSRRVRDGETATVGPY